jgi:MFS transporter, ACS family, tartrate transporter
MGIAPGHFKPSRRGSVLMTSAPGAIDIAFQTRRKIAWHLLPFVFLLYIIAYLDRANVAFAKLSMSADLGFSEAVFGFGAGIFFLGYFLLEIPGALIVEHWSARRWIARILVSWGVFTILVGFVRSRNQFYAARFLLGAAEAGFFPGIIVYLTHWFSAQDRARAMAGFLMAAPLSLAIGAPLSALILNLNWWGLAGWRWVFILEGVPAVLFGLLTFVYLTDHPAQASWLDTEEKAWIEVRLFSEKQEIQKTRQLSVWQALRQRNVFCLALAVFFANIGGYGFILWLPSLVNKASGFSASVSTLLSTLPFALAVLCVWCVGRSSDRSRERRWHAGVPLLFAALFFFLATRPGLPFSQVMLWLSLTGASAFAWIPSFWVLPTLIAEGSAAAVAIGLINSIGNLGGFVGPSLVGYLLTTHHSYSAVTGLLSICYCIAAALTLAVRIRGG